ncbi:hypothetical protein TNCV_522391 [Trichonephila clavipes]|nr:hypothetical protein TNCV_522391 [Trichonephila clavipes]
MVWGDIAYNTRPLLVLIHGTMTAQCKGVTRLSLHCYYPFLACPIARFVSNRAYLGSFRTGSRASHEFKRTRCKGKQIGNEMSNDIIVSGDAHEETGLQRIGTRSSLATNQDSI